MTSHYRQLPRRRQHDIDYDHEPLPPPASSSLRLSQENANLTMMMAPPPLGPLVEPNYQTKLILGDMFSQQATLRNYSPESIQAIMMALDEQKRETQQQLLDEEASLALARQLMVQEAEQQVHPPVSRLSLISSDLDADDWSGEAEEDDNDDENHHGDGGEQQYQGYGNNEYYNDFHCSSVAPRISMQSLEEQHVDSIMPMPMPMSMASLQSSLLIEEDDDEDKKLKGKSSSIGSSNTSTSSSEGTDDRKSAYFTMERVPKAAFVAPPTTSGDRAHHWQHQQQEQQAEEQRAGRPSSPKKEASGATTTTTNKKKKKKKDRQCLICHRSTAECRLRMRKLACGHHFCRSCIDRWLTAQGKDTCPYCRKKVSEETRRKVQRQNSISPPSA